jgi:hypothetical protein
MMRSATAHHLSIMTARANALFTSTLQSSDEPSAEQLRLAISAAVGAYGSRGCAARVAQAYGDHPETAVSRMRWARATVVGTFGGPVAEPFHARRPALVPSPQEVSGPSFGCAA